MSELSMSAEAVYRRELRKRKLEDRVCEGCGESFTPKRANHLTCSCACRQRAKRKRKGVTQSVHVVTQSVHSLEV